MSAADAEAGTGRDAAPSDGIERTDSLHLLPTMPEAFSIVDAFHSALRDDSELPHPIAAIFALSEMISSSKAETTSELMENIKRASEELKSSLPNPIPASAGLELFMRFVTTKNWAGGVRT